MLTPLLLAVALAALSLLSNPHSTRRRPATTSLAALPSAAADLAGDMRAAWRREVEAMRAHLGGVVERLWRDAVPVGDVHLEDLTPAWIRFTDGTVLAVTSPSTAGLRIMATELATGGRVTVSRIYFTGNDTGALVRFDTSSGPVPVRALTVSHPL